MRSWSKWVIFSRRMKSSSSVGPRRPAFSEFWLSATGMPMFVVSAWPPALTRTRGSEPSLPLNPSSVAGSPVLTVVFVSVSELAVTSDGASACWPSGGR